MTEWFFGNTVAINNLAGGTFVLQGSLNATALAKRPFTVTRVVGSMFCGNDQVAAIERPIGAVGMMVVSEKAIATGATAVPDPITEQASDEWFLYRSFGVIGAPTVGNPFMEFQFDSRAQRKVQDGEDVALVVANGAAAAHTLVFTLIFRMLVKLS